MRAVVQRVSRASVVVDERVVGRIGAGLLVLVGVESGDGPADIEYLASKIAEARVFPDEHGRMNRSVRDVGGAVLVVSQFTLLGDLRKGRRPAFDAAARPDTARASYESLITQMKTSGLPVEAGVFQADMRVELINEGPVTILLDSRRLF
ncbi:MAG TPA: D-aminoacyl-tRNA deacylase [Vicinamibacterales bacterium]|nr:D-aminoacyl-tRNA deacylase [Vicinamibacterales bacterium]